MSKKQKLEVEYTMPIADAISHLEELVCSLKEGQLTVERGEQTITLVPSGVVQFELELSHKKDKEKFSVELSWKREAADESGISIGGDSTPQAI